MKLRKIRFVFLACLTLFILGCHKDKVDSIIGGGDESCAVSLRLQTDETLTIVPLTRSGDVPADDKFSVRIENTRGEVLKNWKYAELPSLIKVVPGSYKLVAYYGTDSILPVFEKPFYYGETKVTLKEGDNLDTLVNCSMAAVKVAVEFDKSFGYEYDDYWVDIKTVGDSLSFAKDESRVAYFKPGNLRMRFVLKPIGSNTYYQFYPQAIGAVKAKEFYKMKLRANTDKGDLKSITITTDSSTIDIPVDVELPPFYLPKPAPKVTPQGFVSGETIETTEGLSKPATVMVSSSGGLTELKIKTISDTLLARGWPEEIDLMQATPEQVALLKANGLDWSDELNTKDTIKTTVWVKFDNVVKLLNTAPGQTSHSAFELVAKDRFGQFGDAECKLGVNVAPPVFEFASAPGSGNVYAKKAVYNIKYESEARTPVVEYKTVGGEWKPAPTTLTLLSEHDYDCTGTGLTPEMNYSFRIRLGGHILDAGSFPTEAELQVPNAGMEDWYNEKVYEKKTVWVGIAIYNYYPYNQGESSAWWSTRNAMTTFQRSGTSYYYTSFPATCEVSPGHSGNKAAEISTVGYGIDNWWTSASNATYPAQYVTPGMLFIGDYNYSPKANDDRGDEGTEVFGRPFDVRPDKLSFWYKFKPYNSESFKAYIVLENRDNGTVEVGRGELSSEYTGKAQSEFTKATVDITYSNKYLKATHIYIVFLSSTAETPTTDRVQGSKGTFNGNSDSRYIGNVLTVDDIELIYE